MAQQWFYLKDGTTHGPVVAAQLEAWPNSGDSCRVISSVRSECPTGCRPPR